MKNGTVMSAITMEMKGRNEEHCQHILFTRTINGDEGVSYNSIIDDGDTIVIVMYFHTAIIVNNKKQYFGCFC